MSKIRLGILGGGGDSLIGVLHRVASHMYDRFEIVGGVLIQIMRKISNLPNKSVLTQIGFTRILMFLSRKNLPNQKIKELR